MTTHKDWLPSRRSDIIAKARTWLSVFNEPVPDAHGGMQQKYVAWGIPSELVTELETLTNAAAAALTKAQEAETRTPVTTAACKTAFDALIECARSIKRRFLHSPPLTNADVISLELKPVDKKPTSSGAPTAIVLPEIIGRGQAAFKLRFAYVEGSADSSANKSRRLHYKVVAHGETPPATPEDLPKSLPMNRRIEDFHLGYGDSGKTVYMAVRVENGDLMGPWGTMMSAVIP